MINEIYKDHSFGIYEDGGSNHIPGLDKTFKPHSESSYSNSPKKKIKISSFFSDMSRLGMSYEDDVVKNMSAVPADKHLIPKHIQTTHGGLIGLSNWKQKSNADKNFHEKDLNQKRDMLRKLAMQPELEDILDTMTNEAIVYDADQTYFVEPFIEPQELGELKPAVRKEIQEALDKSFRRFYKMLNWKYQAWDDFKRFLIEGILSWEIVWDSKEEPTKIIGIVPIDPATLTRGFKDNKWYWYQYKDTQNQRTLLDSQVIYISFQETKSISRLSYLERLVRPFNIYRIVEQAQLIWTITNASYKMMFTIPIKGMNRANGMQTLNTAMNRYKEDIKFDIESGELNINGRTNMPFNKEYWMPEGDSGTPTIETLGGEGPELNDNDQLKYFKNQLYRISKIPASRFDQESGETFFGTDSTSVMRTEIDFGRYVTRLRNTFAQIMIKPLQLQLAIQFPDLQENKDILDAIQLQYRSYNLFEEMLEMELMDKRVQGIQNMKDSMVDMDADGNDVKFFSSKFLVQKYLRLSPQDLELNEKLKKEEMEEMRLAGGNDEGNDEGF